MTGKRIVIVERRSFTFVLAGNGTQTTVLDRALDVTDYKEGTLEVAVSALAWSGAATLRVTATPVLLVGAEPQTDFLSTTGIATATLGAAGVAAGTLLVAALPANFGSHVQVAIVAQQPLTPVTLTCTITIIMVLKA